MNVTNYNYSKKTEVLSVGQTKATEGSKQELNKKLAMYNKDSSPVPEKTTGR